MRILGQLRAFVGALPRSAVRRDANRFLTRTKDCRSTQHAVLADLLRLNADSRFSRTHGLDRVSNVGEFQRAIPVTDFNFYEDAIERLKQGDFPALLGENNPLLMFTLSSGTTSASKFIPITKRFLADYRAGWQIWGIRTLDDHPGCNSRNIVQLTSDYDRYRTEGGTPCGNISGLVVAMQKRIVQTMYTVPGIVSKIRDPEARYYTALRLAIADANVGMVTTANPSTLIHLARTAERVKDSLIRDVHDGTLSGKYDVDRLIRQKLRWLTSRRRRRRARDLEQIIHDTGRFLPRDYWRDMQVVAVWTGGSAGVYLRTMAEYYGDVPVRDHGLSASEGRMTIPLASGCADGVLDVASHFFEFIPARQQDDSNPDVLEAHELEEGGEYLILLTTASGLCRYNICDVVRCTGFCGTTPMLEFLHKGTHISNITGEKISESQVVLAVRETVQELGLHLKHFTVSPKWGDPPTYELLVETSDLASARVANTLARKVDARLKRLNMEYDEKRASGRLGMLAVCEIPRGTWHRFALRRRNTLGGTMEQYKHPCLVPDLDFREQLLSRYGDEARPAPVTDAVARPGVIGPVLTSADAATQLTHHRDSA